MQCVRYFNQADDIIFTLPLNNRDELLAVRFHELASELENVGDNLCVRQLRADDYSFGFLALLAQLTEVGEIPENFFKQRLALLSGSKRQLMFVIEDTAQKRIVACGTLFIELKFIHSAGRCGHIEDVVVDKNERGRGLGRIIVAKLRDTAIRLGCYKAILDCAEKNVPFYEKCGFVRKEVCMARYSK